MSFEVNKIKEDEFGRPHGILVLEKPVGITSHDLVDETRKKYKTKKVGHAGTLDPFASGKMIILLGKATKLSDSFLGLDKEYTADIVFGVSTNTSDVEGIIKKIKLKSISKDEIQKTISEFPKKYSQSVPVFSSVKVKGNKLRELARKNDRFEITEDHKVKFFKDDKETIELDLPIKEVNIYEFELLEFGKKKLMDYKNKISERLILELAEKDIIELPVARVRIKCSKGTYIRQLAEDIGEILKIPASLFALQRTRIGDY